ncbi:MULTISPECIES: metal ABC transporter permease [Bacillus]|uniref:Manganese transport system membrane protein MntC n=2 Tax=Bacillus TaxID=1386 RepID=A0A0M4FUL5_9BACI|nr:MULTISPECIES: metal ABC transporter permease [Bacillus]ALC82105.1 manganese ABC transporter permease [Bacillus gobiensis]MBP1083458.1 manganese/zinc/iron transport system permease protein [Bacillus capparidis]MED1097890.1 metal ABC transporter permease [Bacillus capparidis]
MDYLLLQLQNPNTQWVLAGTLLLGIASGVLGSFILLRKQSLIGDAMSHAALPGVCLAFIITGQKSLFFFLIGAAVAALAGTYCIQAITRHSKVKEDAAIGIVLSIFFGIGIVLLTFIQQRGTGNQSGLNSFLFGQAASLVREDIVIIGLISAILLFITGLFFKEFKLITFDFAFAKGIGLPVSFLNGLLLILIICAVVIGLQTVGVILMSAMLITPAIAARYWTNRLQTMVILSGVIGGLSGMLGTLLSTTAKGMATGPLIIVAATSFFIVSLLFAPKKGLFARALHQIKLRNQTAMEQALLSLYDLTEEAQSSKEQLPLFTEEFIKSRRKIGSFLLKSSLKRLEKKNWIHYGADSSWRLTTTGVAKGYELALRYRLFEIYLMHEMEFQNANLKNDSFDYETLSEDMKARLFNLLKLHKLQPTLSPKKSLKGG